MCQLKLDQSHYISHKYKNCLELAVVKSGPFDNKSLKKNEVFFGYFLCFIGSIMRSKQFPLIFN